MLSAINCSTSALVSASIKLTVRTSKSLGYSFFRESIAGNTCKHGPHHVSQKSIRTTLPEKSEIVISFPSTSLNVASLITDSIRSLSFDKLRGLFDFWLEQELKILEEQLSSDTSCKKKTKSEKECPVCYCDLNIDNIVNLQCSHSLCKGCFKSWVVEGGKNSFP